MSPKTISMVCNSWYHLGNNLTFHFSPRGWIKAEDFRTLKGKFTNLISLNFTHIAKLI